MNKDKSNILKNYDLDGQHKYEPWGLLDFDERQINLLQNLI